MQIFIFFLSVFFILQNLAWHLFNFRVNDNAFFICDNLTTSQFDNFRYVKATNWASHSSEIEPVPVNPSFKFFSVSLKFRACYITGQWGEFTVKNASLYWDILSWGSFYCFHQKIVFIIFVSFWWSIEFLQYNTNQSETGIGDKKLSVELYVIFVIYLCIHENRPHETA